MLRTGSLVLRALLAVGLMLGFYALALAVALGLLYIPYAEMAYLNRLNIRLALFCLAAAGFPGLNSFVGEFLIIGGAFRAWPWVGVMAIWAVPGTWLRHIGRKQVKLT